jgi:hypothetical protein
MALSIAIYPIDDEPLTEEEEQALDRADAWLDQNGGKGIPHEEILAEFGLTAELCTRANQTRPDQTSVISLTYDGPEHLASQG